MEYISIKNWERYQHFTDGRPVKWVKVYTDLLEKYDREGKENAWRGLSDKAVRLCIALWLLRAKFQNIPNDSAWIEAQTGVAPKFAINELVLAGFVSLGAKETETDQSRNESGTNPVRDCDESGALDLRERDRDRKREREREEEREPSASARASLRGNSPNISSWYPNICSLLKASHPHADIPKPGSAQERDWLKCLLACSNKYGEEKVRDVLMWVFKDEPQPDDSTAFTLRRNIKSLATLTNRWKNGLTKIATCIEHYDQRDAVKVKKQEDDEPQLNRNGTHLSSLLLRMNIADRIKKYRADNPNDPEDYMMREICTWTEYAAWVEKQQRKRAAVSSCRSASGVTKLGDVLNETQVLS